MKLTKTKGQQSVFTIVTMEILMANSLLKAFLKYLFDFLLLMLQLFRGKKLDENIKNCLFRVLLADSDIQTASITSNSRTMGMS